MKFPKIKIPFKGKEKKIISNGKCEICGTNEFGFICLPDHKKKMRELLDEVEKIASLDDEKEGLKRWSELRRRIG